jgi:hypothetical protein
MRSVSKNHFWNSNLRSSVHEGDVYLPGLPDFSWHNIPKRGKIYHIAKALPNGHKIYQITLNIQNYQKMVYKHFPFYVRPSKIYPNWDFWLKNKTSGNPATYSRSIPRSQSFGKRSLSQGCQIF